MDDLKIYLDEEQKLSEIVDVEERKRILLKRYKREQQRDFFDKLSLWVLCIGFLILCAISLGLVS